MAMFETTHKLDFLAAPYLTFIVAFRVGTCHGLYYADEICYNILAIANDQPGNGHFEDVLQWFEQSCRRDKKDLVVSEIMNEPFMKHLMEKRGFEFYKNNSVIKQFV